MLETCGWEMGAVRLQDLCGLLFDNDFHSWPQLDCADDPSTWDNAEDFPPEDLEFLRAFIRNGRMEPRYAMCVHAQCIRCLLMHS